MQEEEKNLINESGANVEDNTQDYLAAIKELKQNSVNRSEYDALKAENKRLIDSLVNGQTIDQPVVQKASIEELRADLFGANNLTNLEYCTKALELRDAILEQEGKDIFVGSGHRFTPSREDYESAENVASVMRDCIEYAEGNSEIFTQELMRRTNDVKIPYRR